MNLRIRLVPVALAAALLALPGIGDEGGEGAGGTGVWILPRPTYLAPGCPGTTPPSIAAVPPLALPSAGSVTMTIAPESGPSSAVLVDNVSGTSLPLPVSGREVTLARTVLQGLVSSGTDVAHIVVTDSQQLGYVIQISIDLATGAGTLSLR